MRLRPPGVSWCEGLGTAGWGKLGGVIRELKIAYAKACDGYNVDRILSLYTDDIVFDAGEQFGRHEVKAAVRAFLTETWKQLTWALHYMTGESITIAPSGTEATGSWYLWEPCTISNRAIWLAGRYDDEYRRSTAAGTSHGSPCGPT